MEALYPPKPSFNIWPKKIPKTQICSWNKLLKTTDNFYSKG